MNLFMGVFIVLLTNAELMFTGTGNMLVTRANNVCENKLDLICMFANLSVLIKLYFAKGLYLCF